MKRRRRLARYDTTRHDAVWYSTTQHKRIEHKTMNCDTEIVKEKNIERRWRGGERIMIC